VVEIGADLDAVAEVLVHRERSFMRTNHEHGDRQSQAMPERGAVWGSFSYARWLVPNPFPAGG
jgi:hypothetical protein